MDGDRRTGMWKDSCSCSCSYPCSKYMQKKKRWTYNNTIFTDLDVIPDRGGLNHRVRTDVNVVAYFHRVVIEVASICFVRRSVKRKM